MLFKIPFRIPCTFYFQLKFKCIFFSPNIIIYSKIFSKDLVLYYIKQDELLKELNIQSIPAALNSNILGSAFSGISPSLWAKTSSWMIEVLLNIKTLSKAMVGISDNKIRRKAFGMAGSTPIKSNSISMLSMRTILIFSF